MSEEGGLRKCGSRRKQVFLYSDELLISQRDSMSSCVTVQVALLKF